MNDQRLSGKVELRRLLDGESEGFRHRQLVVVLYRRIPGGVEHSRRCSRETHPALGDRNLEPLAIGRHLLMGKRQAAQRLRQNLGRFALSIPAGPRDHIIGRDLLGPDPNFDRHGDAAPGMRI